MKVKREGAMGRPISRRTMISMAVSASIGRTLLSRRPLFAAQASAAASSSQTGKNIILCCDGTWNQPEGSPEGPQRLNTNVAKLAGQGPDPLLFVNDGVTQVVLYEVGVGIKPPIILGGAFGVGLFEQIARSYARILSDGHYQTGDRLYLFGFSRGAYMARALAGMLSLIGLPTIMPDGDLPAESRKVARKAFAAYQFKALRAQHLAALSAYKLIIPTIAIQGMWDTVGSLGLLGALTGIKDPVFYEFLDTDLYDNTRAAFHATSIDERRGEFILVPWPKKASVDQELEQVWFSGVHTDVGGSATVLGTGVHGVKAQPSPLANITLSWMLRKAEHCGAILSEAGLARKAADTIDPKDAIVPYRDSYSPVKGVPVHRRVPAGATLASSVVTRLAWDATYRPENLSLDANDRPSSEYQIEAVTQLAAAPDGIVIPSDQRQVDTGVDVVAGQSYRFSASGSWVDKDYPCGPEGDPNPGGRQPFNAQKRSRNERWMALLGRIDDGPWFPIGEKLEKTFEKGGRLFCCANDAPLAYGNNQGSVILKVSPKTTAVAMDRLYKYR